MLNKRNKVLMLMCGWHVKSAQRCKARQARGEGGGGEEEEQKERESVGKKRGRQRGRQQKQEEEKDKEWDQTGLAGREEIREAEEEKKVVKIVGGQISEATAPIRKFDLNAQAQCLRQL